MHLSDHFDRAGPKGRTKSPVPQEGEIRAAGLEGILLAGPEEDDRRLPSPKNFSDPGRGELQRILLLGTSVNRGWLVACAAMYYSVTSQ